MIELSVRIVTNFKYLEGTRFEETTMGPRGNKYIRTGFRASAVHNANRVNGCEIRLRNTK